MSNSKPRLAKDKVVVNFAGDSGDGIQLSGFELTRTSTLMGNDVRSAPDIPAEIRAPQGTLLGISGFKLCFSSDNVYTAGDEFDTLVAMNPAALVANISYLKADGCLIIDSEQFNDKNFKRAGLSEDPLLTVKTLNVVKVPLTRLTQEAVRLTELSQSKSRKCKNFMALGMVYWLYDREVEPTLDWIEQKFKKQPDLREANKLAFLAGYHLAETGEYFVHQYFVPTVTHNKGLFRHVTGNLALALGAVTASYLAKRPLTMSGYPITPASDILHHLATMENIGIQTVQAEDEMAAIGIALGAAYAGHLGLTCTSGPGMDLKAEMMGLAVMTELPLVVVDVMRAGPSTGMPTRSEQTDLLMARFGRHGECECPILAPLSPKDCYEIMVEAYRLATKYMVPVIVLSDAYLANGAEPMAVPNIEELPPFHIQSPQFPFQPYNRDTDTLARPWAVPGQTGFEHRIGGLEKELKTGNISNSPEAHEKMVLLRQEKVRKAHLEKPFDYFSNAELKSKAFTKATSKIKEILLVGWGSTYGVLKTLMEDKEFQNTCLIHQWHVSGLSLRQIHPLPKGLKALIESADKIIVVENNTGQLHHLLSAEFLRSFDKINNITGKPMALITLKEKLLKVLNVDGKLSV